MTISYCRIATATARILTCTIALLLWWGIALVARDLAPLL